MSLENFVRRASPVALSLLLAGCGGGGAGNTNDSVEPEAGAAVGEVEAVENTSSENSASSVSGRVADGYIQGAVVCVDINENDSCDADEPSTVTGNGGTYNLDIPAGAQTKSIVADIPAEAIDEDTGEAVGKPLVFIAPADKPGFLSPITTLIHQELRANPALDVDDAERTVKSILGIDEENISLFSDYVAEGRDTSGDGQKAEKFRYLHDTARVVASLMKDIETQVEDAALSSGVDVAGADIQRAIREIVRSEVRELLPEIARQVADLVLTDGTSGQTGTEAATGFNPDQLAENLRPVDAGENVEERIDAVRDRVDVVQSDIEQLLTDGVYWMEFDCHHDDSFVAAMRVEGETTVDAPDGEFPTDVADSGEINYPMPECKARYGHVQLNAAGDSLVTDDYLYDGDTGGWVLEEEDEDDFRMANYSLVKGEWILVQSGGPEGQVEFTDDGTAVIVNEEGRMQLKAVTQEVGGTRVINHFWQDDANPLWFSLVESTDMFSADSLAHKISVRQSSHPFMMFNHQPQDDQSREFCAQYLDNCNVVNAEMDGQHHAVTSLDEIRDTATLGIKLVAHSAGFGNDGVMKLSAELPADGTLPAKGSVHWMMSFDGNHDGSGEMLPAGTEPGVDGVDPYNTYPAGNDDLTACHGNTGPDGVIYPEPHSVGLPVDGALPDSTFPADSDATDVVIDGQDFPEKPDCADLIAHTGSGPIITDYQEAPSTDAGYYAAAEGEEARMLVSEWKLIEIEGVRMIEIQLPFILRQESDADNGQAILLVEHDGYVRLGARLPETFVDRVITYNETAFATLRSIVETGIDSKQ